MKTYEVLVTLVLLVTMHLALMNDPESSSWGILGVQAAIALLVLQLMWIGLFALLEWRRDLTEVEPEVPEEEWNTFTGSPQFHPAHGIYLNVFIADRFHKVVVNPDYWQFLPKIQMDQKEAMVRSSPMGSVPTGKEPGSLVCIQDQAGNAVGMGVRVHCGSETVLLTSYHVLKSGKLIDLYLAKYSEAAKAGLRAKLEREWKTAYVSGHKTLDIIAVSVPPRVWSALGVKASVVDTVRGRLPVTVYGAKSTKSFFSSMGFVSHKEGFELQHSCSTEPGWSGSPLFYKDRVVGIHRRWDKIGESNVATLISPFHNDTESSECIGSCVRELEEEELAYREGYEQVLVDGRAVYLISADEYARKEIGEQSRRLRSGRARGSWADEVEEDDFTWDGRMEASIEVIPQEMPLNYQKAASACSPPHTTSEATNGVTGTSSPRAECRSLDAESRLATLEKLVEKQLAEHARTQRNISQLSQTLVGLSAALKPSSGACSSKQDGSGKQNPPPTSLEQSVTSYESTQGSAKEPASKAKPGKRKKSKGKSSKSAPEKSSGTPAPGSPGNC